MQIVNDYYFFFNIKNIPFLFVDYFFFRVDKMLNL